MTNWLKAHQWIAAGLAVAIILVSVLVVWVDTSRAPAPYDDKPSPITGETTVEGEAVCLPHKNTDGPQTLECAFGVRLDNGTYYSLRDTDEQYGKVSGLTMGEKYQFKGTLKSEPSDKYQSIGELTVDSVGIVD